MEETTVRWEAALRDAREDLGSSLREIAERNGVSYGALRKRIQKKRELEGGFPPRPNHPPPKHADRSDEGSRRVWVWDPAKDATFFAGLVRRRVLTAAKAAADIRMTDKQAAELADLGEDPERIKDFRCLRLETLAEFFRLVELQGVAWG